MRSSSPLATARFAWIVMHPRSSRKKVQFGLQLWLRRAAEGKTPRPRPLKRHLRERISISSLVWHPIPLQLIRRRRATNCSREALEAVGARSLTALAISTSLPSSLWGSSPPSWSSSPSTSSHPSWTTSPPSAHPCRRRGGCPSSHLLLSSSSWRAVLSSSVPPRTANGLPVCPPGKRAAVARHCSSCSPAALGSEAQRRQRTASLQGPRQRGADGGTGPRQTVQHPQTRASRRRGRARRGRFSAPPPPPPASSSRTPHGPRLQPRGPRREEASPQEEAEGEPRSSLDPLCP